MSMELFKKKSRPDDSHLEVTISKNKSIVLGRYIVETFVRKCKNSYLYWDSDSKKIGLKLTNDDGRDTYGIHYSNKERTVAQIAAMALLSSIRYQPTKRASYPAKWNAKENQLEIQLRADVLTARRRRRRKS